MTDYVLDGFTDRISCGYGGGYPDGCRFNQARLDELRAKYQPLFDADNNLISIGIYPDKFWEMIKAGDYGAINPKDPETYKTYTSYDMYDDGWRLSSLFIGRFGDARLEFYQVYCDDDSQDLAVYLR